MSIIRSGHRLRGEGFQSGPVKRVDCANSPLTTIGRHVTVPIVESKLAQYAEQQLIEAAKRMTREERLAAFIEHSRRVNELFHAGQQLRDSDKRIGVRDES
jgi:hypothetical protein